MQYTQLLQWLLAAAKSLYIIYNDNNSENVPSTANHTIVVSSEKSHNKFTRHECLLVKISWNVFWSTDLSRPPPDTA